MACIAIANKNATSLRSSPEPVTLQSVSRIWILFVFETGFWTPVLIQTLSFWPSCLLMVLGNTKRESSWTPVKVSFLHRAGFQIQSHQPLYQFCDFTGALGQASSDKMNLLPMETFFFSYHYLVPSTGVFLTFNEINSILVRTHFVSLSLFVNHPIAAKKILDYNFKSCTGVDPLICFKCFYFRTLYLSWKIPCTLLNINNKG